MPRLLGYKKFTSKAGKKTCYACIALPPKPFDVDRLGFVGEYVDNDFYVDEKFQHLFIPENIGKNFIVDRGVDDYGSKFIKDIVFE